MIIITTFLGKKEPDTPVKEKDSADALELQSPEKFVVQIPSSVCNC